MQDGSESFARPRSLTFRGYMDLVWQSAYHGNSASAPVYAVRGIDVLSSERPSAVLPLRFRITSVALAVPASEQEARFDCAITRVGSANELHESLSGTSLRLRCGLFVGKAKVSRREREYRDDFGLAIPVENVTAAGITRFRITSVSWSH